MSFFMTADSVDKPHDFCNRLTCCLCFTVSRRANLFVLFSVGSAGSFGAGFCGSVTATFSGCGDKFGCGIGCGFGAGAGCDAVGCIPLIGLMLYNKY